MDDRDTPHERARYAYNKAGEQVAHVSTRIFNDAQTLARQGRRHMNLVEPPRKMATTLLPVDQTEEMAKMLTVDLFVWQHRNHADCWAIRFLSDADQAEYLRWFPQLALEANGLAGAPAPEDKDNG